MHKNQLRSKKLFLSLISLLFLTSLLRPHVLSQTNCSALYDTNEVSLGIYPDGSIVYLDVTALSSSHDPAYQSMAASALSAGQQWVQALGSHLSVSADPAPAGARTLTVKPGSNPDNPDASAYIPRLSGPDRITYDSFGNIQTAAILINLDAKIHLSDGSSVPAVDPLTSSTIGGKVMRHEMGHVFGGLRESKNNVGGSGCFGEMPGATVMNSICGPNDSNGNLPLDIPTCDSATASSTIVNSSPVAGGNGGSCPNVNCNEGSGFPSDTCAYGNSGCPDGYYDAGGCCQQISITPIIVDVDGKGFNLTDVKNGVNFDFFGTGIPQSIAWTAADSSNAFLVLDKEGDGVKSGKELFGNVTSQPQSLHRNGFLALAEYDKSGTGDKKDGLIDARDKVFTDLRLWQDRNHNGISESGELFKLPELGVRQIELDYKESHRIDQFGNVFRYRAKLNAERYAYDVFLAH